MICEQGDIVSLNFDPSLRHEPAGRHYAVVVSPFRVNSMSSLTVVVPVTSTDNGYPLHVPLPPGDDVRGFAQCEALRAMDLGAREHEGAAEVVGSVDDETLSRILACVLVVIGADER